MYHKIETERLVLRPLDISDLETVHVYASDEENTTYMIWLPNNTMEETTQFLTAVTKEWEKEAPGFYEFAVVFNGLQIGAVSISLNDTREIAELGWIINKNYWGQGIAFEAAFAVKEFALKGLKVKKIIAHCDYRNVASYNLMKKLGMTLESDDGVRTYRKNNETAKELAYSLIPK